MGGIESVTVSLAKGAVKAGHTVTVVCFKKSKALDAEVIDGVRVLRMPSMTVVASQPLGIRYIRVCLREASNADIIHLHAPNMLAAFCCLFSTKKTRLIVHWHSDVIGKGFLGCIFKPLERGMLKRASCVIATSQIYADASSALKRFKEKIKVVPIGVPDAKKAGLTVCLPDYLTEKLYGKRIILTVGRLVPYKGFDILIESAKLLEHDVVVVIVGEGPLQARLRAVIATSGVADRVLLVGQLSGETLHALFNRAMLYCMPSVKRSEAFGVVLLEAMAHGLPIVATDIPGSGVPWVNRHGVTGINVSVGDPVALAQACNQILCCNDVRLFFAEGSRQRFIDEFTEEALFKRVISIYEELVMN
jgi:glycosyltransferase involved in cell wall biosynthesis